MDFMKLFFKRTYFLKPIGIKAYKDLIGVTMIYTGTVNLKWGW
jgi:hypothetical protein